MTEVYAGVHLDINSRNRDSGTDSDFEITLNVPTALNPNRFVVMDASLPKSYYTVQDGYNTFIVTENGVSRTISMDPGNSSRTSFQNQLISKLNSNAPSGVVYDVTFPNFRTATDTGLFTYNVTGNSGWQPIFDFTGSFIYEQLGFAKNSVNSFVGGSLTSTAVINMSPESVIYLTSPTMIGEKAVLQRFYLKDVPDFDNYVYSCSSIEGNAQVISKAISKERFCFTDEEFTPLNFNGRNINMHCFAYRKLGIWDKLDDFLTAAGISLKKLFTKK